MGGLAIFGFGQGGWGLALLEGAAVTLLVSACGLLIGAAIGGLIAWARLSGKLLAGGIGQAYAALFRGLPELLIVYFVYFGTSTLLTEAAHALGHEGFVGVPSFAAGALAVGVISGAYQAEVFRAAYLAISRGELEAAVSVGMNRALLFRRIIMAQVLRFALPGLGNLWQVALKDSSLISVTGPGAVNLPISIGSTGSGNGSAAGTTGTGTGSSTQGTGGSLASVTLPGSVNAPVSVASTGSGNGSATGPAGTTARSHAHTPRRATDGAKLHPRMPKEREEMSQQDFEPAANEFIASPEFTGPGFSAL